MAKKIRVSKVKMLTNPFISGIAGVRKHPDIEKKKFREFLPYVLKEGEDVKVSDKEILFTNAHYLIIELKKKINTNSLTCVILVLEMYKYEYFTPAYIEKTISWLTNKKQQHIYKMMNDLKKKGVIDVYFDKNKDVKLEYKQIFKDGWEHIQKKLCLSPEYRSLVNSYVTA